MVQPPIRSAGDAPERRWTVISVFLGLIVCSAVVRLWTIQVRAHEDYAATATAQHVSTRTRDAVRGTVFIQDGEDRYPLATNRTDFVVYAVPSHVEDPRVAAERLAPLLEKSSDVLLQLLVTRDDPFVILARRVSEERGELISAAQISGIGLLPFKTRFYPAGSLAAHIVGFLGFAGSGDEPRGQYGIEASYDDMLRGNSGKETALRDAAGRALRHTNVGVDERMTHGSDITLTIEHAIQYEAERILANAVEEQGAVGGSLLVLTPDGSIRAMASVPTFDPNVYNSVEDFGVFRNPIISIPYEPGSVIKPLVMAAALDAEVVNAHTPFNDPGSITADGFTIKNAEGKTYGTQTMTGVLEHSINTGMIFIERLLGHERLRRYLEQFGFGSVSGITLPAEAPGSLANIQKNHRRDIEFYTASFGQGITATPLQLGLAYAAVANGGILPVPRIVAARQAPDNVETNTESSMRHVVLSPRAAEEVTTMLERVVTDGHGKRAAVPGYRIAGKTGTAQVAKTDAKGYADDQTIGTFAGFAPADDPKFVVIVKIVDPKKVIWAESSAAPVFGKMMTFLLSYANIVPTRDPSIPVVIPAAVDSHAITQDETVNR